MTLELREITAGTKTLGHQSVEPTGGNNPNLRVLHCCNVDTSLNYQDMYLLVKKFGEVERIRMKLTSDEACFNCFIIFKSSKSAFHANNFLNGHSVNDCTLKTKLFNVSNLQEDPHHYIPEEIYSSEKKPSRSCPHPLWFVATYKSGRENYAKGIEAIQIQAGSFLEGSVKRYGRAILIKARDFSQAKMLMNFKSQNTIIDRITPHKTFNTMKGVMYSKDIYEYTEDEILERCPPNVCEVRKLRGINNAILLTFSTEYIPDYIRFGTHIKISVKRYRPKPIQCFKCLDYGHVITRCSNPKRCEKCSSEHQEWNDCNLPLHCFHCMGSHSPTSKECNRKKLEQEVAEVALYQHISISNAKRQVLGANRDPSSTYASVIKQTKSVKIKNHPTSLAAQTPIPSTAKAQRREDPSSSANSKQITPREDGNNNNDNKSIVNNSTPAPDLNSPSIQKDKSTTGARQKERKNLEPTSSKKSKSPPKVEETPEPPVKKRALALSPTHSQELELSNSFSVLEEMEEEMVTDGDSEIVNSHLSSIPESKGIAQSLERSDSVPSQREISNRTPLQVSNPIKAIAIKANIEACPDASKNAKKLPKSTLKHANSDPSMHNKSNSSSSRESKIPILQAQSRHSSSLKRLDKNLNLSQTPSRNSIPAHANNAKSGTAEKKSS